MLKKIREGRAKVEAEQRVLANVAQGAKTVKDLAGAKTDESNVLTELAARASEGQGG